MSFPQASLTQDSSSLDEDKAADDTNAGRAALGLLTFGIVQLPHHRGARLLLGLRPHVPLR